MLLRVFIESFPRTNLVAGQNYTDCSFCATGLRSDCAFVLPVDEVLFVDIALPADFQKPGLDIYLQARAVSVIITTKDSVNRAFG